MRGKFGDCNWSFTWNLGILIWWIEWISNFDFITQYKWVRITTSSQSKVLTISKLSPGADCIENLAKNPDKNISIGGNSLSVWHAKNSSENETAPSSLILSRLGGETLGNRYKIFLLENIIYLRISSVKAGKPDIFSLSACIIEDISKFCKEKKLLHQIFPNFKAWYIWIEAFYDIRSIRFLWLGRRQPFCRNVF